MSRNLILPLKGCYFDDIVAGRKPFEYRLRTAFWRKRLEGRTYDTVTVTKGYPAKDDAARRATYPWRGYEEQTIKHDFFGAAPVEVFAIRVGGHS